MEKKLNILVVGSILMDHLATTEVFPREGQTVMGKKFNRAPGGKGANQAVQCARLGANVTMVGKVGNDAYGKELLQVCKDAGMNTEHIITDPASPTGCSFIVVEERGGQAVNRIIVLPGANAEFRPEEVDFLKDTIGQYDMVILQLEIPMAVNERVAEYAAAKGVPVMLNPAPSAPLSDEFISHLTYISPNEHEAADLAGIAIPHDGSQLDMERVRAAAAKLRSRGVNNVLITLGDAGAALDDGDHLWFSPCAEGINAVDPTAAGDSFVGSFCVGLGSGLDVEASLRFANKIAAVTVCRIGAMPALPTLAEAEEFWKESLGLPQE